MFMNRVGEPERDIEKFRVIHWLHADESGNIVHSGNEVGAITAGKVH